MWVVSFSFCFPLEKQAVSVGRGGKVRVLLTASPQPHQLSSDVVDTSSSLPSA